VAFLLVGLLVGHTIPEECEDGDRLATADMLIAATARSTGDELVVANADFQTDVLQDHMTVTNLGS